MLPRFVLLLAPAALVLASPLRGGPLDYNRDIRPILSENCFACHGFNEKSRKAKLRLDVEESACAERKGRFPIKPGDLSKSEAWRRITSSDPDEVMPPPEAHSKLSDADKSRLKQWIEEGAKYAGHWAFILPQRPPVPPGSANALDAFIRQRLAEEGLKPSPPADRFMLIRRLYLDLTGLPPSAEEANSFAFDKDPKALDALTDLLLASPHFGERMALDWLDSARYADSNGFSIDGGRHMWLWRDWVIQAFNDNKPYDRFLVEQIAGDLLPQRTEADLIATGFQRNNMVTHEGGTIPEENLTNYNVDRVKTLGESVLGLTLGCAQCHDHKFDPLTQKDYYQMYAFFNTLGDKGLDGDGGVNPGPFIQAKTVLKTDEVPGLQQRIDALKNKLAQEDAGALAKWESRQHARLAPRGKNFKAFPVKVLKVSTPNRGAGFEAEAPNFVRLPASGGLAAYDVSTQLPAEAGPVTGLRIIVHPQANLPGGGWGGGAPEGLVAKGPAPSGKPKKGTFVLTSVGVSADAVPGDQINLNALERLSGATASSWDERYPPRDCLNTSSESGWSPDLASEGPVHLTVAFAKSLDPKGTPFLTVQLNFGQGRNLTPARVELQVITGADDDADLPPDIIGILRTTPDQRGAAQKARLWSYLAANAEDMESVRVDLENAEERLAALTRPFPTMVMNVAERPRETFILNRGDYAQPTVKVTAGAIASLPPLPEGAPSNRLGLAQWVTMKSNPLTARVAVNRIWKLLFGAGLVSTPADFGLQGEWPSHPHLLDWLAVDFMESGWDVKRLVRMIVMSETYRQTSAATPELLERDPQNRLLARGPRFRLDAEWLRDQALKVGGLLVPQIGGPSVNPYTPGDLWREVSHFGSTPATAQSFLQDHGDKLYRRSLYTFWKRTAPPPNMLAFDAPNREICTVARGNTTTPLQALVTLNDPQFVEAARAFAQRIIKRAHDDDAAKLRWAMTEAISRPPTEKELGILERTLARERKRYAADIPRAKAALAVGESPRDESIPPFEHAAWMQVASLIMNLSESITRN